MHVVHTPNVVVANSRTVVLLLHACGPGQAGCHDALTNTSDDAMEQAWLGVSKVLSMYDKHA
jgi:hypothetical protein